MDHKRFITCLFLFSLWVGVFLSGGCTTTDNATIDNADAVPEEVFALVNGKPVRTSDIHQEINKLSYYYRLQLQEDPEKLAQFLDNYLTSRLMLQEAKGLHLDETDTFSQNLQTVHNELLLEAYMEYLVSMVPVPGDTELRQFYNDNQHRFMQPARIKLAYIQFSDAAVGESIIARLNQGESFSTLRQEYSIASDSIVFLSQVELNQAPPLRSLVWELPIGAVSALYAPAPDNLYIFRKEADLPPAPMSYDTAREQVLQIVREEQISLFITVYISKLKRDHPFEIIGDL